MKFNTNIITAGVDKTITATVTELDEIQNLTGHSIFFNLAYMGEDDAIISKVMTVSSNSCTVNLSYIETSILDYGEYDVNLIIIDPLEKRYATERYRFTVNKAIPSDSVIEIIEREVLIDGGTF